MVEVNDWLFLFAPGYGYAPLCLQYVERFLMDRCEVSFFGATLDKRLVGVALDRAPTIKTNSKQPLILSSNKSWKAEWLLCDNRSIRMANKPLN